MKIWKHTFVLMKIFSVWWRVLAMGAIGLVVTLILIVVLANSLGVE